MHSKSLASWITPSLTSKYDCPDFFEQIIMNPEATYEEYPVSSSEETQLMMILYKTKPSLKI
ncbi:hypothetical protein [Simkania negevensis]|uniref:Uncharacterized protein n=1 Tax=Simkania negevensis (strain ATCC VR-1471 / DSM 27360 / Z) TaxID=331113 RepID=F8L9H6_SIMNZ|nr:hypothetical protein [Simkania negevensis]CCB89513.1 unknown protein [Simkania negevensis Z]